MIYELIKSDTADKSMVKLTFSVCLDVYVISQMSAICLCLLS